MTINEAIEQYEASKTALEALQAEGVRLPFRPAFIATQELHGNVVDLESGAINIVPGANGRFRPTAKGLESGRL